MATSQSDVLRHLRRRPDDEEAWGVLGDVLQDAGDPRGTLIALQQELTRVERSSADTAALFDRIDELQDRLEPTWPSGVPRLQNARVEWTRGFATKVLFGADAGDGQVWKQLRELPLMGAVAVWATTARAVVEALPAGRVHFLRLHQTVLDPELMKALAQSPAAPGVRNLEVYGLVHDRGIGEALLAPSLIGLERLDCEYAEVAHPVAVELLERDLRTLRVQVRGEASEVLRDLAGAHAGPNLRQLALRGPHKGAEEDWARFLEAPWIPQLEELTLAGHLYARGARAVATASQLAGLQSLDVGGGVLGREGFRTVLASPVLRPQRLSLRNSTSSDTENHGVDEMLATSELVPHLRELDLSSNHLGEGALQGMVARVADRLELLRVWSCSLGDRDLVALASTGGMPRLRYLGGSINDFGDPGLAALAAARWPRLEHLDLRHAGYGDEGGDAIARSTGFPQVRGLRLGSGEGVRTAESLAAGTQWSALRELHISGRIGSRGFAAIARSTVLARLRVLRIEPGDVDGEGVAALAEAGSRLQDLYLAQNPLGNEGAVALASSTRLSGLRMLNVHGCGIGDVGIRALARAPWLGQLSALIAVRNEASDGSIEELKEACAEAGVRVVV